LVIVQPLVVGWPTIPPISYLTLLGGVTQKEKISVVFYVIIRSFFNAFWQILLK
jgi:hypothetical protein